MTSNAESTAADRAHVFHSWSAQDLIQPVPVAGGSGGRFWDHDGNEFIDFSSQLVNLNLGHQHPRMIEAIRTQAETLCTIAPVFANDARSTAAAMIAEHAPEGLDSVFFTNGGAEAVENALRMAKLHTGGHKVLSAYRSYHGATAAAIAATGEPRRWASEPTVPGSVHFFGPYLYRSSFGATTEEQECERALAHLEEVIAMEGPSTIAALILETVVGTNGVLVPPPGYLQGVRELCTRNGILMISDEVMVGFGRLGEWFGVDHWGVTPDLITFAKGVNSGYVPLGGVIISEEVAASFATRPYPGGLTYSGHPLACAAAVESMRIFEDDDLVARSARLGAEVIGPRLEKLSESHRSVGEVRGLGCFFAVELVRDPATREMLVPFNASGEAAGPMNEVLAAVRAKGVWPFAQYNRIHVAPPLVIDEADLISGLDRLDEALEVADAFVTG